jgi:hypothetical protein
MKWISNVVIILFAGIIAVQYFDGEKKQKLVDVLFDTCDSLAVSNMQISAEFKNYVNETGETETVYHARDYRTKDFFSLVKIGRGYRGYQIVTDLPDVDRAAFDFIYWTCVDSNIDISFLLHVLWSESRFGTNITHKVNKDGTKDGGWFGINYKDPNEASKGTPYTDVYKFIKKYRKLEAYPKHEWASRYNSKVLWKK